MKIPNILKSIGLIFLYIILSVAAGVYIDILNIKNDTMKNIVLILASIVVIMVVAYFLRDKFKGQFEDFKKNYPKYIEIAIKYWLVGFTFMIISNLIINYFAQGIAPNEDANREIIKMYPLYSIVSVCVLSPIEEELAFRLNFRGVIKKRLPFIIIVGLLFGGLHIIVSESLFDLLYIIPYSALGFAFSAAFYDTDNIFTSIFAHMLHNTITIALIMMAL